MKDDIISSLKNLQLPIAWGLTEFILAKWQIKKQKILTNKNVYSDKKDR